MIVVIYMFGHFEAAHCHESGQLQRCSNWVMGDPFRSQAEPCKHVIYHGATRAPGFQTLDLTFWFLNRWGYPQIIKHELLIVISNKPTILEGYLFWETITWKIKPMKVCLIGQESGRISLDIKHRVCGYWGNGLKNLWNIWNQVVRFNPQASQVIPLTWRIMTYPMTSRCSIPFDCQTNRSWVKIFGRPQDWYPCPVTSYLGTGCNWVFLTK